MIFKVVICVRNILHFSLSFLSQDNFRGSFLKIPILLLFIAFLFACSTMPEQPKQLVYSSSAPNIWTIEGKISSTLNTENETVDFEMNHQDKYNHLILTGLLGFGQIDVQQKQQGLWVDGKLSTLSLPEWDAF